MADTEKPKSGRPESPTTARELDFDDDDVPASPKPTKPSSTVTSPTKNLGEEPPRPTQPPLTTRPETEAEKETRRKLQEMFGDVTDEFLSGVLYSNDYDFNRCLDELLGLEAPNNRDEAPPPQPPRPTQNRSPARRTQEEEDARLAAQMQRKFDEDERRQGARRQQQRSGYDDRVEYERRYGENPQHEPERNFVDHDLQEIGEQIKKGFYETRKKVTDFISDLGKRFEEDDDDIPPPQPPRRTTGQYARRSNDLGRRSADRERYDADPQVLSDDFTALQMNDNDPPPRTSSRPSANPDLFKPTPRAPYEGRRVSFQEGPPEEIGDDLYRRSPDPTKRPSSTASNGTSNKNSKWQPLAAVDPSPVADHDPFSLGDSDDEESKKKDIKPEDSDRLKKATAEAMADELGEGDRAKKGEHELGAAKTDGTKDAKAEELTGSK